MKKYILTLIILSFSSPNLRAQELPTVFCKILFDTAIDHAKKKDHEKDRLLNRLVEKINPIDRIEKGWDEISGRNKTELPGKGDWKLIIEQLQSFGCK